MMGDGVLFVSKWAADLAGSAKQFTAGTQRAPATEICHPDL
jgi:hypothetical protein